jgi:hypothetical protein
VKTTRTSPGPFPTPPCPCCGKDLLGSPSQRRCPTTSRTVRIDPPEATPPGWPTTRNF